MEKNTLSDLQKKHIEVIRPVLKQVWWHCDIVHGSLQEGHEQDMVITGDGLRLLRYTINDAGQCVINYNPSKRFTYDEGDVVEFDDFKSACEIFAEANSAQVVFGNKYIRQQYIPA